MDGLTYEVVYNNRTPDTWNVEAIGEDGQCYVAVFSGPQAKERAIEYADWKTGKSGGGQ